MFVDRSAVLIEKATGRYPVSLVALEQQLVRYQFGEQVSVELLDELGYIPVKQVEKPDGDVVEEIAPALEDGWFVQQWSIRSFTEEELALRLNAEKAVLLTDAKIKLQRLLDQGFDYVFPDGKTRGVQIRDQDRVNLTQLLVCATAPNTSKSLVQFRTRENEMVCLAPAKIAALCVAAFAYHQRIMQNYWAFEAMVRDARTNLPVLPDTFDTQ